MVNQLNLRGLVILILQFAWIGMLIGVKSGCANAQVPSTLPELIEQYLESSKPLREFYQGGVQIRAEGKMQMKPKSEVAVYHFEYFANGKQRRCDSTNEKTGEVVVYVATPNLSFELSKKSPDSPYVVQRMSDPYQDMLGYVINEASFASAPIALLDREIVGWLRGDLPNEKIALESVRQVTEDGVELIEVKLRRTLKLVDKTIDPELELVFLKNKAWALHSLAMRKNDLSYHCKVKYEEDNGKGTLPLISSVRFWKDTPEGVFQIREYQVTSLTPTPAEPIADYFQLSSFGIEGDFAEPDSPWYRECLIVLTLIAIAGLTFLVMRKRLLKNSG